MQPRCGTEVLSVKVGWQRGEDLVDIMEKLVDASDEPIQQRAELVTLDQSAGFNERARADANLCHDVEDSRVGDRPAGER